MIKVNIGSILSPTEVITDESKTITEVYSDNNVIIPKTAMVLVNADVVQSLNKSLKELGVEPGSFICYTTKEKNA